MATDRSPGSRWHSLLLGALLVIVLPGRVRASGLEDLRRDTDLTPGRLIRFFADFSYELSERVQDGETFLQRKRGDCDDFAKLADKLLTERGYKTKLVVVMMEKQTHVVCFVQAACGYLDFNRRAEADPIVLSNGTLEDIANKVSANFRSKWWMVSEVKFRDSTPVFVDSVFPYSPVAHPVEPSRPLAITNTNAVALKETPEHRSVLSEVQAARPTALPATLTGE
jgi:hypothetical protein